MFSNLFSVNNKHPLIKTSTSAVRCLKCFEAIVVLPEDKNVLTALWHTTSVQSNAYLPYGTCKCNNCGIMLDSQGTLRVYVDDINSVHIGNALLNKSNEVVAYHWTMYSETFIYNEYYSLLNSEVQLQPSGKKKTQENIKKPKVNSLVQSLDLSAKAKGRTFFYSTKE